MQREPVKKNQQIFNEKFLKKQDGTNILYIHTPFCPSRCSYCIYHYFKFESPKQIEDYYHFLLNEIEENRQVLDSIQFDQVYFGGGTPTVASPGQMEFLFERIPHFQSIPNKISEASPNTLTEEHIYLFEKYQFRFISIGVQSLDKAICEKQNRYFISRSNLKKFVKLIQKSGMYVNLDFICFMNFGDLRDVPQFSDEMNMVLKDIRPDYVTIHTMHQSIQSIERSRVMIEQLQILIDNNPDYMCVNSLLDSDDASVDAFYSTEYRLGLKEIRYSHYMFNKYAVMPVEGYNIYALGNYKNVVLTSNVGKYVYLHNEEISELRLYQFNPFFKSSYEEIRKSLNL